MTGIEVLKGARKLLERRGAWVQYAAAVDGSGMLVGPMDSHAMRFCLVGAVTRAAGVNVDAAIIAQRKLRRVLAPEHVTHWNDATGRRKHQVLAVLDEAIGGA